MAFILPIGIIIFLLISSNIISNFLKLNIYEKPIFICGFFILFLNYAYFNISTEFKLISILILIFSIISSLIYFFYKFNFFEEIKKLILPILPILFLFQLIFYFYGEQFYIFRGNQQDTMVYLTTGLTFFKNTYNELLSFIDGNKIFINDKYYLNLSLNLIEYRPSVGLLIGLLLNLKFINIIILGYIFKILCTCLTIYACIFFFDLFEKSSLKKIILSYVFVLSFFYFYNFEIDAFSLILSLPFFIVSLKYLIEIFNCKTSDFKILFIKYFLISAIFFVIYPNGAAIMVAPSAFLFIVAIYRNRKNLNFLKNFFIGIIIFLVLVLPTYKTTILYLMTEMNIGLTHRPDFWGYYGAFIFGKDNPIHDRFFVEYIKSLLSNDYNLTEIVKIIIKNNFDNNPFFVLNIIPSIFGLFHLTTSKIYGNYNFILLILLAYLNYYLIRIIIKNFTSLIMFKNNYFFVFRVFIIYFLIFFFYLIFTLNLWSSIKLYFIFSPIIFMIVVFNFDKNKIKPVYNFIILLLILLPFYKYSSYNNGIGILDSFPSIINKQNKLNQSWIVNKKKLSNCKLIYFNLKDHRENNYISILHNTITKNNPNKECSVFKKDNKFDIEFL